MSAEKSSCCGMSVIVDGDDEFKSGIGTCFYRCIKCGEVCDVINPDQDEKDR